MNKWETSPVSDNSQETKLEPEKIVDATRNFRDKEAASFGTEQTERPERTTRTKRLLRTLTLAASMFAIADSARAVELFDKGDHSKPLTPIEIALKDRHQDESAQKHVKEAVAQREEREKELTEKVEKLGKFVVVHPDSKKFRCVCEEQMLADKEGHILGRLVAKGLELSQEELEEQARTIVANTGHGEGGTPVVFQSEQVLSAFENTRSHLQPGMISTPGAEIEVNSDGKTRDVEIGQNGERGFTVRSHNKTTIEFAAFTEDGTLEHHTKFPYKPGE